MRYKLELMFNGHIQYSKIYLATHPKQMVRLAALALMKISRDTGRLIDFATVYIINEDGQAWRYGLRRVGNVYRAKAQRKWENYVSEDEISMVFAGNKTIANAVADN